MADVTFSGRLAQANTSNQDVYLTRTDRALFETGEAKLAGIGATNFANQGPDVALAFSLQTNAAEVYRLRNP